MGPAPYCHVCLHLRQQRIFTIVLNIFVFIITTIISVVIVIFVNIIICMIIIVIITIIIIICMIIIIITIISGQGWGKLCPLLMRVTLAIFKDQQSLNKITGQVIISEVNISPKNLYFFTDHKNGPA